MGLDMYLETMPKVKDYTVKQIHDLAEATDTKDTYEKAMKALEELKTQTAEAVADKNELMYFSNDTPERFKERMMKYVNDPEVQLLYHQSLTLDETIMADVERAMENKQEVAYWRKANQIHAYFIDHIANGVDDCKPFEVTKEQLETLARYCAEALLNKDKAHQYLPTQGGFFFGSTDYDEYYFEDLKNTVKQVNKVLKDTDFETTHVLYQASW